MTDKISITFDEDNRIRVLDADKYRETDQLKTESMEFIKKVYTKITLKQTINF
jgi:intraflagellar transport protein 20